MDSKEELTPAHVLQIGIGFWASKVLLSAVEIGVFTELAKGPEEFNILAGRMGMHMRSARDFLDALVALGFLQRSNETYSNAPETDLFLDRRKSSYVGGILEMANARLYGFWNHLTEALRTGRHRTGQGGQWSIALCRHVRRPGAAEGLPGRHVWNYHGANIAIACKAPWANSKSYADVGTAQGDLAVQIALRNPHLKGIGFDLAEVGPIFDEYAEANGVGDRVHFQAGDFFKQDLPNVDVITMGHILHDWSLDEKKMLIGKALTALNPGGALVVYDAIIDDDRSKNAFGLMASLNMLIETPAGFDYTAADCIGWMKDAGFREARVEHLAGPDSMVIAIK